MATTPLKIVRTLLLSTALGVLAFGVSPVRGDEPTKLNARNNNSRNNRNANGPAHANRQNNTAVVESTRNDADLAPAAPPSQWPLALRRNFGTLKPDVTALRARIEAMVTQSEVADPVVLKLLSKDPSALVRQLAKGEILDSDGDMPDASPSIEALSNSVSHRLATDKFTVTPDDLGWIDLEKLSVLLQSRTVLPTLEISGWRRAITDPEIRTSLEIYFQGQFPRVARDIEAWSSTNPEGHDVPFEAFLPRTVRPLYGKYSHLKGRNCFGTALEFATPRSKLNKTINVEREDGHFRTMINSDEFMRALWLGYYELKPGEVLLGLKWGDVVVLYDDTPPLSWMSLRHAVVHMAGDVYFHKQSKSAASPIEFTDWQSVMNVWTRLTPRLGYKVFRPLPTGSSFQKPNRAIEKLSWTR